MTNLFILLLVDAEIFGMSVMALILILWLLPAFLVALTGKDKPIGYWGVFFISLLLSPLVGLIVGLASSPKPNPTIVNVGTISNTQGDNQKNIANTNFPSIQKNTSNNIEEVSTLMSQSIQFFSRGNHDTSLALLNRALKLNPYNPRIYFNLVCLYSAKNDIDNCLQNLHNAIEYGYNDFEKIDTVQELNWLRKQEEYKDFQLNGYAVRNNIETPKIKQSKLINMDKIEALEKIALLKEKGILSEIEFEEQKKKLLDS